MTEQETAPEETPATTPTEAAPELVNAAPAVVDNAGNTSIADATQPTIVDVTPASETPVPEPVNAHLVRWGEKLWETLHAVGSELGSPNVPPDATLPEDHKPLFAEVARRFMGWVQDGEK